MSTYHKIMKSGLLLATSAAVIMMTNCAMAATTTADEWAFDTSGDINITHNVGGEITVACVNYGGWPSYAEARLSASSAQGGGLSGDFYGAGANAISFNADVIGNIGAGTRVTLNAGSGRSWYSYTGGAGGTISKPVASPWTPLGPHGAAEWEADLSDVVTVGVTVNRGDGFAQSYAITDFSLGSERDVGSLSPLEAALFGRFGVTSISDINAADATADSDGDGMTDLNEILAENDPDYYANNLFLADVVSVSSSGVTVEWACIAGASYQIYRADSLTGGGVTAVGSPITPSDTGYATAVEPGGGPGGFYWVQCTGCD
jgi:hypothetical protein